MKKINYLSIIMLIVMALPFIVSCSKDDDGGSNGGSGGGNITVVVNENGTTSNGSIFSAIDDKNFYLDYIKYTVEEGHLVVSGYDKAGFKDIAKIVSRITYKGNTYEVLKIGVQAFYYRSSLKSVIIPNSVTSIGPGAFSHCSGLTSITIPNSVTSIENGAFSGCSGLTSIIIPKSVTYIGEGTFDNTAWFNNQPDGLVYAGNVAYKYKGTMPSNTGITLKEGTVGIANAAFQKCFGLMTIIIPNSVTSIGEDAFVGAFNYNFYNYIEGVVIICRGNTPPNIVYSFDNITYQNAILCVPKGSIDAYKKARGWENFEMISDDEFEE